MWPQTKTGPVFRTQLPWITSCAVISHLTPLYLDFLENEAWRVVVKPAGYLPAMCEYSLQGPVSVSLALLHPPLRVQTHLAMSKIILNTTHKYMDTHTTVLQGSFT